MWCVAKVLLDNDDTHPDADPHDLYWTLSILVSRRSALVKPNGTDSLLIHQRTLPVCQA